MSYISYKGSNIFCLNDLKIANHACSVVAEQHKNSLKNRNAGNKENKNKKVQMKWASVSDFAKKET